MSKSKKSDLELKRQIKEMEDKKRAEAMAQLGSVTVIEQGSDMPKISFEEWWMLANLKVKMKPWLKEILWADFKSRGLSGHESEAKYDETLRIFGIKW